MKKLYFNPPTLIVDNMARLSSVPDSLVSELMQYYTILNPEYEEAAKTGRGKWNLQNIPKYLKYFQIEKDEITFPRGVVRSIIQKCAQRGINLFVKDRRIRKPLDEPLEFNGKLRDYQAEAGNLGLANDFGIIEASTGAGKTVIACYIIAKRSVSTIVAVPTKELMYQWVDRLKKFTSVNEVGLIGDDQFVVRPITVAVINSLAKHGDELKDSFEFLVVDEAHRAGSAMYISGPLSTLPTHYMLGLSATMYRNDGKTEILYWFLGNMIHGVDPEGLRETNAVLKPLVYQKKTDFLFGNAQDNYQAMISRMVEDSPRNALIAGEVVADVRHRKNGVALVVSDRTGHLEALRDLISQKIAPERVALLTGKTNPSVRKEITEALSRGEIDVLLATLQLISEGYDCPGLVSLHFATPVTWKGRVIQTVGRILRPEEDKTPVVVDYVDSKIGLLEHRAKQRLQIFQNEIFGIPVKYAPWQKNEDKPPIQGYLPGFKEAA